MSDTIIIPQDTELDYTLSLTTSVSMNGNLVSLSSPENSYYPLRNNDFVNITSSYVIQKNGSNYDPSADTNKCSVSARIISTAPDSLPNGLTGNFSNNTYTISGSVSNIIYSHYSIVIRFTLSVYDSNSNLIGQNDTDTNVTFWTEESENITFYWDMNWLNSLPKITFSDNSSAFVISQVGKGAYINNSVLISSNQNISNMVSYSLINPVMDLPQTFKFNGDTIQPTTNQQATYPKNISIKQDGSFGGSVSSDVEQGYYFFSVSASININGTTYYGTPNTSLDTRGAKFCIVVGDYYEYNYSNQLVWKTKTGSLGEIYEGYPSYFSVEADSNYGTVIYSLAPYSTLPDGMYIDTNGYVSGNVPYTAYPETITFSVRANVENLYSDREFSFDILPSYGTTEFFNLQLPIYLTEIRKIRKLQNLITDNIFRKSDPNYGININYYPYFISGLLETDDIVGYWDTTLSPTDKMYGVGQNRNVITNDNKNNFQYCLLDKLENYHKAFKVTVSDISSAKMYSVDNQYLCDVVYLLLSDNHNSAFTSSGSEILQKNNHDVINHNLDEYHSFFNERIFVPSISNCRNDLLLTTNRINSPTRMKRPNAKAGIGLVGEEGMPSWMRNSNGTDDPIGYIPAVVLAYIEARYGNSVVEELKSSSEFQNIIGLTWVIDRYIFENKVKSSTIFDNSTTTFDSNTTLFDLEYGYSKSYTTFDNDKTTFDSASTLFDVVDGFNESFLFFPKEIINDIEY